MIISLKMLKAFNGACSLRGHAPSPVSKRLFSSASKEIRRSKGARHALLRKIYKPFASLDKGSPDYNKLAQSGRVWEEYFQPYNSQRLGYKILQQVCKLSLYRALYTDYSEYRSIRIC